MEHKAQETPGAPAVLTYTVDSFADGIAFGQHKIGPADDIRDYCHLRLDDDYELVPVRSHYRLSRSNPLYELERHLMRLSRQGLLQRAHIVFGMTTDPFHPFNGKFPASMKFLQLFERYTPGMLNIQTRSPLMVIALPVLQKLGGRVMVTLGIETCCEAAVQRYTAGLPSVEERLKAARTLRRFGIPVSLQVSPVLPYGDWQQGAAAFAELLCDNGDYVHVRPVHEAAAAFRRSRQLRVAKRLAADRKFHWLRSDAAAPLRAALERIAPHKLLPPRFGHLEDRQLTIFAA